MEYTVKILKDNKVKVYDVESRNDLISLLRLHKGAFVQVMQYNCDTRFSSEWIKNLLK